MLAQLFLTPSGMMVEVAWAAAAAVEVAVAPQEDSAGLLVSQLGMLLELTVSHALDSVVGTDRSVFSL